MPQNGCFHRHRSRFDLPVVPSDNIRLSLLDTCLYLDSVGTVHTDNTDSHAYIRLIKTGRCSENRSVQCRDPVRSGLTFYQLCPTSLRRVFGPYLPRLLRISSTLGFSYVRVQVCLGQFLNHRQQIGLIVNPEIPAKWRTDQSPAFAVARFPRLPSMPCRLIQLGSFN